MEKIDYNFKKEGKYTFKIIINTNIDNLNGFFEDCSNIIYLDLSYLNTSNVTNMYRLFHNCNKLKGWGVLINLLLIKL